MTITEKLNLLFTITTILLGGYSFLGLLILGIDNNKRVILTAAPLFVLSATVWVFLP